MQDRKVMQDSSYPKLQQSRVNREPGTVADTAILWRHTRSAG